jgi:hypothetical protein
VKGVQIEDIAMLATPKKFHSIALCSLLAITSAALYAADESKPKEDQALTYENAQLKNLENRVTALEEKKSRREIINPTGRPHIKDGVDWFLTADFLYWKATETGLPYAMHSENTTTFMNDGAGGPTPKNRVDNPSFKWRPGARAGVGYNMAHDEWDLYFCWTWFQNDLSTSVNGTIFPIHIKKRARIGNYTSMCRI